MRWLALVLLCWLAAGCGKATVEGGAGGEMGGSAASAPAGTGTATRAAVKKGLTVAEIQALQAKVVGLNEKMGKPKERDWLATHPEPGQTFVEFVNSNPGRLGATRTTLYVQPLGEFTAGQGKLVDDTVEMMAILYGMPVKKLPGIGLDVVPAAARRVHPQWGDKQILTSWVLEYLRTKVRPADAVAVIALTTSDLWPGEGWNFVFGEASLTEHVGVWSLYRYGDLAKEDYTTVLRRTLKVATHETGHMLGMAHCTAYYCGMNGSNNREEMDAAPMAFCAECAAKVWWACREDPKTQCEKLAAWAEGKKLVAEAAFWRREAEALGRGVN